VDAISLDAFRINVQRSFVESRLCPIRLISATNLARTLTRYRTPNPTYPPLARSTCETAYSSSSVPSYSFSPPPAISILSNSESVAYTCVRRLAMLRHLEMRPSIRCSKEVQYRDPQ
jgi:hypothetical protein